MVTAGVEKEMETISTKEMARGSEPRYPEIKLSAVDGLYLKVSLEAGGPIPLGNDPAINGVVYRVCWIRMSRAGDACPAHAGIVWTITDSVLAAPSMEQWSHYGSVWHGSVATSQGRREIPSRCRERCLKVTSRVIRSTSVPQCRRPGTSPGFQIPPHCFTLAGVKSPEVHFSSVMSQGGPFPVVFEAFHYMKPPRAEDLTCSVIKALGDKFDFLAYYSDFRIDNPEAGTSSDGPLGGGPAGGPSPHRRRNGET